MQVTFFTWIISITPIALMLLLMLRFKWGGMRAGAAAWLLAVFCALTFFGANWQLIAFSQIKAILLALDLLLIVTSSLFLYNLANEAGAIKRIADEISKLVADRGLQVLLIAWLLSSFFQGMGGYGVPMAVCAPILVSMGYSPVKSAVMAAMGHNWTVTYGIMAGALIALAGITGVQAQAMAPYVGVLLGLTIIPTGMIISVLSMGWKGTLRRLPAIFAVGGTMALTHHLMGLAGLWTVAVFAAVILGGIVLVLISRLRFFQKDGLQKNKAEPELSNSASEAVLPLDEKKERNFWLLVCPYLILLVLGFATILIKPLKEALGAWKFSLQFPEISTRLGWSVPAGPGKVISVFSNSGALAFYACVLSCLVYWFAGILHKDSLRTVLSRTLHASVDSSLGVLAMIGVAVIMEQSGMTYTLSKGLSEALGKQAYPAVVPATGLLGAILTGANVNSNLLFGRMHFETARLLGLNIPLILAAQSAGASLGSVCAPAKIIVGCTTVGMSGQEGRVLQKLLPLIAIPTGILTITVFIWSLLSSTGAVP